MPPKKRIGHIAKIAARIKKCFYIFVELIASWQTFITVLFDLNSRPFLELTSKNTVISVLGAAIFGL
jgi:hypothetical protein